MTRNIEHGTTLTRWNPWEELADTRRHMDEMFNRLFATPSLPRLIPGEPTLFEPYVDIYETTDKVFCFVALPGFPPEAINVEVNGSAITLFGEHKPLFEEEAFAYRQAGVAAACNFRVVYNLPVEIDPVKVKAIFFNGILKLEMLKTELARKKTVKVNVIPAK